jgi:hypothetical protein
LVVSPEPRWQMIRFCRGNPASRSPLAIALPRWPAPKSPRAESPRNRPIRSRSCR